jgi:hypothetical protein
MFDEIFFRQSLQSQAAAIGGNPVVRLVLRSGEEFLVRDVVETQRGVVLLNVHPPEHPAGIVAPSSSAYTQVPTSGYYPLAVSYEAISHVQLSTTTAEHRLRIGFHYP